MARERDGGRELDLALLGGLIRAKRREEHLTLEEAARQTGVSAATLSRWERFREGDSPGTEPDRHKLHAVTQWLGPRLKGLPQFDFLGTWSDPILHGEGQGTVEIVEAHLRADPKLDSRTAEALGRLFRVAYEQFAGSPELHPGESESASTAGHPDVPSSERSRE